jgi:hypothetical protein
MHVHADPSRRSNEEALEERRSFRLMWSMHRIVQVEENKNTPQDATFIFLSSKVTIGRACQSLNACASTGLSCHYYCGFSLHSCAFLTGFSQDADLRNLESTRACFQKVRISVPPPHSLPRVSGPGESVRR